MLAGMFRVVETIFGVQIRESQAPAWHPTVRFFDVRDAAADAGRPVLSRPLRARRTSAAARGWTMRSTAAATARACSTRSRISPAIFPRRSCTAASRPALFTHDEVQTLFHEFGHGLHLLLTQVDVPGVSGTRRRGMGRRRAAEPVHGEFLLGMGRAAAHDARMSTPASRCRERCSSGCSPPKNFQSGMQMVRQLEFALFDMHLHYDFDADAGRTPLDLLRAIRREVAVVPRPDYDRCAQQFQPHLRRWLRGRLLQLQMGRGAFG